MKNNYYPFINLPLPYSYDALEPYIDQKTMKLHHDKHLQTYINNLNDLLKNYPHLQRLSLEQLIKNTNYMPKSLRTGILNNAGGIYNHRFFFNLLKNPSDEKPKDILLAEINNSFGSFDNFKNKFKEAALSVFGSGYTWLVYTDDELKIINTPNQNSPIQFDLCPVLAIDVWEHAYYLKHYNLRADYIDDWFKVINWEQAEKNLSECIIY